jgi:erythromycin esterase-like protein
MTCLRPPLRLSNAVGLGQTAGNKGARSTKAIVPRTTAIPVGETLRGAAHSLTGSAGDYDPLMELIGDARIVLLGEASHGTHEFYRERARITRNRDVLAFVSWLRDHNDALSPGARKAGFYGLDLYSLFGSIEAVIRYLDEVDPEAARRARYRYGCFDHFGEDSQAYGYSAEVGMSPTCENEAVHQLLDLQRRAADLSQRDGRIPEDEFFYAEQNARLVKNAEEYYRSMFRGRISSWNLRDRHMVETLEALLAHFDRKGGRTRAVVWEHNSHIGDARATSMGREGEWNVGQLTRERHGSGAVLVGFSTYTGTVTAASDWGAPAERKRVRPGLTGSVEALFHSLAVPDLLLPMRGREEVAAALREIRLERAIGVIYRPETERLSHYFEARLPEQFDAVIHFDETRAVEPLDMTAGWKTGEAPETYPFGQ